MVEAGAIEHVDEVVRRDVAGRGGRERTPADAADRCIDHRHPVLDGRVGVGDPGAPRVVEVDAERNGAGDLANREDPFGSCPRVGDADGVSKRYLGDAERRALLGNVDEIVADTGSPRFAPSATMSASTVSDSSVPTPWLRRLKVSDAPIGMLTSSTAVAVARCQPRSFMTRPM